MPSDDNAESKAPTATLDHPEVLDVLTQTAEDETEA